MADDVPPADQAPAHARGCGRAFVRFLSASALLASLTIAAFAVDEMETFRWQSRVFTEYAQPATFSVAAGASDSIRFPETGPYDRRLGYSSMPAMLERLRARAFEVSVQARWSPQLAALVDQGLFALYDEKQQTGLAVFDSLGVPIVLAETPREIYGSFDEIPPLLVTSLLFIENRHLLDDYPPTRNPALEWGRLTISIMENALDALGVERGRPPGGSTLATQLEKFRHSPEGRTHDWRDKLIQMLSASMRAYRLGADTSAVRRDIVVAYLNGVPLSAMPSQGEVFGLRDALRVWFGADPDEVDRLLRTADPGMECAPEDIEPRARAYRQVLSLILAQRRPSAFFLRERVVLDDLVDAHLRVMRAQGIVPVAVATAALDARTDAVPTGEQPIRPPFADIKMESAIRTMLLEELGAPSLHELDRYDLEARTTIAWDVQRAIRARLMSLHDPDVIEEAGLVKRSLLAEGTTEGLIFSFTLYEHTPLGDALRVQVDTDPQPLNVNAQVKLDLGSTAKLRTLTTYLHIVSELFDELGPLTPEQRRDYAVDAGDALTTWVLAELRQKPGTTLPDLLERAMLRIYSASPNETFFTGGGEHRFGNFDNKHDGRRVTVRESFRRSINLPFVRLMRDIVRYYLPRLNNAGPTIFTDPDHPGRRPRLERFAEAESAEYLAQFRTRYAGLDHAAAIERLVATRKSWFPLQLAVALRSAAPDMPLDQFAELLRAHANERVDDEELGELYDKHAPGKFSWNDLGYLSKVHPLELWWVARVERLGGARWADVLEESAEVRRHVYEWLFKPTKKRAQDTRIRIVLEEEAFKDVHRQWARVGYPFDELVPSYASAIGAAADRPDALARLVGTIANDGIAPPAHAVTGLSFAQGTPYETHLERTPQKGERVLRAEVASRLEEELRGVVTDGTARRLISQEPYKSDPRWVVGGKTGTGDHRHKTFDRRGNVLTETPVSRSATFVFYLTERFYGTMTVYVEGQDSGKYTFTSSLPVTLLDQIAPDLAPLLDPTRPVAAPAAPRPEPATVPVKPRVRKAAEPPPALPLEDVPQVDPQRRLLDYEDFIELDAM